MAVRIAEVDGAQRRASADLVNGTELDLDRASPQVRRDSFERNVGREAEVDRARCRPARLWLELTTGLVQVQLLIAERERSPSLAERDRRHAEHPLIERDRLIEIGDGEDDVVDALDCEGQGGRGLDRRVHGRVTPNWRTRRSSSLRWQA